MRHSGECWLFTQRPGLIVGNVKISGMKEMSRALEKLPKEIVGAGARGPVAKTLRKTMKPVRDAAERHAPYGNISWSEDPGRLKRNIMLYRDKEPERVGMTELYTIKPRTKSRGKRDDPNNAWYWHFVEFGTSQQSAQPYLRRAWEENRNSLVPNFRQEIGKEIERIGKRLERQAKKKP